MPALKQFLGSATAQDIDQVAGAEVKATCLVSPVHTRQRHLRLACCVPRFRRFKARIAIAARLACFAKVAEQAYAPAGGSLAEAEQRIELAALHALVRVVGV